jgi:hypothetical protein
VRLPAFSRQTETDTPDADRPTTVAGSTPVRPRPDATSTADLPPAPTPADPGDLPPAPPSTAARPPAAQPTVARAGEANTQTFRTEADRAADVTATEPVSPHRVVSSAEADRDSAGAERVGSERSGADRVGSERFGADRVGAEPVTPEPVVTGPKPRASLLATLGLILAVAGAMLVLSGPLLGYGIGVAGVALLLSLGGIRATRKRHVAGKSDALIGIVLALAAIVVGVLALTGALSWLGTDMHPVTSLREWLDAQFTNRF